VTTDSWALWKETKAKDAGWQFMKFLISKEYYEQQARIEGFMPSRKSVIETWINYWKPKLASSSPSFNFKAITDALTTMNYAEVDEVFLCQNEAERVLNDVIGAVLVRGEKPASYFRDMVGQINQAAGSCGAKFG
jgi:ABC-type glycerol-3-phosphate transport system substrate-binding protein